MEYKLTQTDPYLKPFLPAIERQQAAIHQHNRRFLDGKSVQESALGHLYFGLQRISSGWIFREWAPNATAIYVLCSKSNWRPSSQFSMQATGGGTWEIKLDESVLQHGDHFKLHLEWAGGSGERIPSYATYVVQGDDHQFDAVVWWPEQAYQWKYSTPPASETPLIYEAHVGMSSQRGEVASYNHFRKNILPKIVDLGYNTIQLMAIQEHPYYGSFGYHVSSFFAASSRFGTPDDLKKLIDEAHRLGLRVIMDVVHSHAVKNEVEGLSRFDGTLTQYFHAGDRGNHSAWDSRVFDYGKPEVNHFLLSNLRWWLDEYRFDGFRFDGITSMIYLDHGLERNFSSYDDYFSDNIDHDALGYLSLATKLIHSIRPDALIVAEDMSGFPGLAAPVSDGGIGFDRRLSMGVPDLWIKTLKEKADEDWPIGHLLHEITAHRPEEKTISYAESHDQALVGDKTIMFRLADEAMYHHMQVDDDNLIIERAIALHKMIRLLTMSTASGGYLNFMGNEFGHPEWIDFPRQGNDWSYHYARRQWGLAEDPKLKYHWLNRFDKAMIAVTQKSLVDQIDLVHIHEADHVVSFQRGDKLFVFNFSPSESFADYSLPALDGDYQIVLSSDNQQFGGQDRIEENLDYSSVDQQIKVYLPARTALVLQK